MREFEFHLTGWKAGAVICAILSLPLLAAFVVGYLVGSA
jgi:hypothetical protein